MLLYNQYRNWRVLPQSWTDIRTSMNVPVKSSFACIFYYLWSNINNAIIPFLSIHYCPISRYINYTFKKLHYLLETFRGILICINSEWHTNEHVHYVLLFFITAISTEGPNTIFGIVVPFWLSCKTSPGTRWVKPILDFATRDCFTRKNSANIRNNLKMNKRLLRILMRVQ